MNGGRKKQVNKAERSTTVSIVICQKVHIMRYFKNLYTYGLLILSGIVFIGCSPQTEQTSAQPEQNTSTAQQMPSNTNHLIVSDAPYPLREKYPNVQAIGTAILNRLFNNDVIIVDVRSKLEYDVVHINEAKLLPLAKKDFGEQLAKLRSKTSTTPLVFYCNGHTCAKSYKASKKAMELGFNNVFSYDAGIFDWINAHPEKATMLDETPIDITKIIPKSKLTSRLLDFDTFSVQSEDTKSVVIDIRDGFQRDKPSRFHHLAQLSLNDILPMLKIKAFQDKQLLIFDAVGKQIKWLQYYLEQYGYTNYSFLEGGLNAYSSDKI